MEAPPVDVPCCCCTDEDGHCHGETYRLAVRDPALHHLLLDALRGEPDRGLVLTPVFVLIEGADPEIAARALDVVEGGTEERRMAEERVRDVALVRAAVARERVDGDPPHAWSRWAQRQACVTANDLGVLDTLASDGFSRHVRAQAAQRARMLRREASTR